MRANDPKRWCVYGGILSMAAGAGGMLASFLYLSSWAMADIVAGTSGFVAGAILAAGGLLSTTVLATFGEASEGVRAERLSPSR